MQMGNYIRILRKQKGWSQEELGAKLSPPVGRAGINKWETGRVDNIKRNHIAQMSKLFNVSPFSLMCFDEEDAQYSNEALYLLDRYNLLTEANKTVISTTIDALLKSQVDTN